MSIPTKDRVKNYERAIEFNEEYIEKLESDIAYLIGLKNAYESRTETLKENRDKIKEGII